MCDTCLALTIKTPNSSIDDVPSSLLLTFNIFHAFSGAFTDGFEKLNAGWVFVDFIWNICKLIDFRIIVLPAEHLGLFKQGYFSR